jgi:hypothetical protein
MKIIILLLTIPFCETFDTSRPISTLHAGDRVLLLQDVYGIGNNGRAGIKSTVVEIEAGGLIILRPDPAPVIRPEQVANGVDSLCSTGPDARAVYTVATSDRTQLRLLKKIE